MKKKEEGNNEENNEEDDGNMIRHSKTSKFAIKFISKKILNQNDNTEQNNLRKTLKGKQSIKKNLPISIAITKEDVYQFLSKNPNLRSPPEINIYAKYLSKTFHYFTKLKNEDSQLKVEKLTKVCKLQKTKKGDSIINFGEIGDKFYIVLEGMVEIFKPVYVEITATPIEFMNTLNKMRKLDDTDLKYNRIKEKNKAFFDALEDKANFFTLNNTMKYKQVFIIENEEKLGEFGEGFSFGEIALIKKAPRNATIRAKEDCILLTIDKDDYNKALLEFQKKKLSQDIEVFLKNFSFLRHFSHDKIITLFNFLKTKEIFKGDYLYKQNMEDDSIYFISYGTFSINCIVSFSWINDYLNYINYSGKNILQFILKTKNRKINEILKIVKKCKSELLNNIPNNEEKIKLWEKINEKGMEDNLYKLKKDEEKLNDPECTFNISLKKINYTEILGLEEVFEFKKRFYSCKCLSEKAEVRAIRLSDFLKLIINFAEDELIYFINMIEKRKKILKSQIIKGLKNVEKRLLFNFDTRFEKIIKSLNSKENENDEEKKNMIYSTIKVKGYKDSIKDILDNDAPLLVKEEKNMKFNQFRKIRKNKSIENIANSYGLKKNSNNEFKFKTIKSIFKEKTKPNEENLDNKEITNINSIYDLINKSQLKNLNSTINRTNIRYNNKISPNNGNNKSFNTIDSFKSDLHYKIKFNSDVIKNKENDLKLIDSKFSNEKTNISSYKSKLISQSTNINMNNNEKSEKLKLGRNISMPNFYYKNPNKKRAFKETISINESFNLPKIINKTFFINTNMDKSGNKNMILVNGNQDYNNFYNIYNERKNFFLGVEFQKKIKKKFKIEQYNSKDKILKI